MSRNNKHPYLQPKAQICPLCGTEMLMKHGYNFYDCPNKRNHYKFQQVSNGK